MSHDAWHMDETPSKAEAESSSTAFIREKVAPAHMDHRVAKRDMRDAYTEWCSARGVVAESNRRFNTAMRRIIKCREAALRLPQVGAVPGSGISIKCWKGLWWR